VDELLDILAIAGLSDDDFLRAAELVRMLHAQAAAGRTLAEIVLAQAHYQPASVLNAAADALSYVAA
jgi:hypothetical protein